MNEIFEVRNNISDIKAKKYVHSEQRIINEFGMNFKLKNMLLPNRCQLLGPISENIELISENIQNTDTDYGY